MSITNIHEAKTNLSKLVAAAERGEEVIIARAGRPAARLVACIADEAANRPRRRLFGAWREAMSPLADDEWAGMDNAIEKSFADSEIFPK